MMADIMRRLRWVSHYLFRRDSPATFVIASPFAPALASFTTARLLGRMPYSMPGLFTFRLAQGDYGDDIAPLPYRATLTLLVFFFGTPSLV